MKYDELPEIMTAQNIADYLGISRKTVYKLLEIAPAVGGIPRFNIGASKRVDKIDFKHWLDEQKGKLSA